MSVSNYEYETDHERWEIDETRDGSVYLYRFIESDDNPPFGGRFVFHSDHNTRAEAERAADSIEWAEHPVEREALAPIPLVSSTSAREIWCRCVGGYVDVRACSRCELFRSEHPVEEVALPPIPLVGRAAA